MKMIHSLLARLPKPVKLAVPAASVLAAGGVQQRRQHVRRSSGQLGPASSAPASSAPASSARPRRPGRCSRPTPARRGRS